MATAYSTFARDGMSIKPSVIRRIENNNGQVIESFAEQKTRVFAPEPVAELVDVLQDVIKYGTGTQAKLADRPVAGKTGTADEGKDIWFIGFTPDLVTAVWGGNDENLPIPGHNVTGGVVMAKIWQTYNQAYYKAYPTPPGSFAVYDRKLAQQKLNALAQQNQEKQPGTQPEQQPTQTADFLQPKVEKIDEVPEHPAVGIKLTPQQASPAPAYKPAVEPIVEELPAPSPAPDIRPKTRYSMPPVAPAVVHTPSAAPAIQQPTLEKIPSPSQESNALSNQAPMQGIMATPEKQPPAHTGGRLYPYQPKSTYRPFTN
jgi:membrane peptidoglycan carboxypeptidase